MTSYNWTTKNNPIKKWAEDLNRHFSKEYIWCSTPVWKVVHQHELSGNCKSKPQYYFTSIRMTIVKKTRNNRWRGCEEKGTLIHCWRDCKLVQSLWKKVCKFFKKFRTTHTHTHIFLHHFLGTFCIPSLNMPSCHDSLFGEMIQISFLKGLDR